MKKTRTCLAAVILATFLSSGTAFAGPNEDLFAAIKEGSLAKVKQAVASGAKVNAKDENGRTALAASAASMFSGREDRGIARFLVEKGADVNAKSPDGESLVMTVYRELDREIRVIYTEQLVDYPTVWRDLQDFQDSINLLSIDLVRLILQKKYHVNVKSKNGSTDLMFASAHGHLEIVKLLVAKGANIHAENADSHTALVFATYGLTWIRDGSGRPVPPSKHSAREEVMKFLIEKGGQKLARGPAAEAALVWAVKNRDDENADRLMKLGVSVRAKDKDGKTLLMLAAEKNNLALVKRLKAGGLEVDAADREGKTALMLKLRAEMFQLLLDLGADVNARDAEGVTVLMHWAGRLVGCETLEKILAKGADVNAKDKKGRTALWFSIANDTFLHGCLVRRGADFDTGGIDKNLLDKFLVSSIKRGYPDEAAFFIGKGASVNARDKSGAPALAVAMSLGAGSAGGQKFWDMAKLLIKSGADVNYGKERNYSYLMTAAGPGCSDIELVKLLIDKGIEINRKNAKGETALAMARKAKRLDVVRLLKAAGARE